MWDTIKLTAFAAVVSAPLGGIATGLVFAGGGSCLLLIVSILSGETRLSDPSLPLGIIAIFVGVWIIAVFGGIFGMLFGIPIMIVFSVLIHGMFRWFGWTRWQVYVLAGALIGIPAASIGWTEWCVDVFVKLFSGRAADLSTPLSGSLSLPTVRWSSVTLYMIGGAFSGGFFWRIRRPDEDLR